MSLFVVLHQDEFLNVTVPNATNREVSTLLDNTFERPLFLLYPIELFLREVVGQGVVPEVVDGGFPGPGSLDLAIVELSNGFCHVLVIG